MKPYDSFMPYILASMHPLLHMSMLFTGMLLMFLDYEQFYLVTGTCDEGSDAYEFQLTTKYTLMWYILTAHLVCIWLHYLYQILNHYDFKGIANCLLVAKVGIFIYTVMEVQTGITFEECNDVTDNSHVMAWLTYEVIVFYLNLISVVFFLAFASFKQFTTIRERLGYAGQERKSVDFLAYCMEDIHWWQMWFTQVSLYICGLLFRRNKDRVIGLSAIQTAIILALGAALIMQLYFNSKFEFTITTKISIGSLYVICLMMIPRYITLRDGGSIWWAPVVLEIIVAHFLLAVQMGVEYFTWNEKKNKWLMERRTFEEFQATDASERDLRQKFKTITLENAEDFTV